MLFRSQTLRRRYAYLYVGIALVGIGALSVTLLQRRSTQTQHRAVDARDGNGALEISVMDTRGLPVAGATVAIVNGDTIPPFAFTMVTDDRGVVGIDHVPAASGYHITVTRPGYSSDATMIATPSLPDPIHPPVTVATGERTHTTLLIDALGTLELHFINARTGRPMTDLVSVTLTGSRLAGTKPNTTPPPDRLPIFRSVQTLTTRDAVLTLTELDPDTFTITENMSTYAIAWTDPPLPVELIPGTTQVVTIALTTAP